MDRLSPGSASNPDQRADRILTLPEISKLTRLTEATLRYKRYCGQMPFIFKLGRRLVAYESDVHAYIERQRDATRRP